MEWEEGETLFPAPTIWEGKVCPTLSHGGEAVWSAPKVGEEWHAKPHHREEIKGRGPKSTAKKAGRYDSSQTIYISQAQGSQPAVLTAVILYYLFEENTKI